MKNLLLVLIFALGLSTQAMAQKVEVKGVGTISYEGSLFSKEPSDSDKKKVLESAKLSAWKNYVATFSPAKQKNIISAESEIKASIDRFITDIQIIDQKVDPSLKTYTVLVRVGFNGGAVDQLLQSATVGTSGAQSSRSKDSLFSFLFMARKATSVTQFDARVTKIEQRSTSASVEDNEGGGATTTASSKSVSGGSSARKEDKISYAITSSQDVDAAMGEILNTAGVEYAAYDDIVGSCNGVPKSQFSKEYVQDDELTPQTRTKVINAARECGVRYFATGTLDVGVNDIDPVSGNRRVYVSVRAQLWDISTRLPRKIGSVGPVQFSGLGPDQSVASRNALQIAAKESAKNLVDQLNSKGVR